MAIILNDNIDTRAPKPTDNRFGPYTTTAAALEGIPAYQRYVGLTVGVGTPIVEWWFDSTLTLVLKTTSGTVTGITAGTGISITGTVNPTISVTTPTQLTTNLSIDVIADGASDVKYPSVKATKTYVDANVAGLLDDRGNFPATSGDYPTTGGSGPAGAIRKGDLWFISVPGDLNGIEVGIGASVRALVDGAQPNTDADWDILDTGLGFIPENVANKVIRGTSIAAAPTSETLYASLSALTEYLSSIPPTTPTLEQVLAATPTQTAAGYDINLESLDANLTTNVGRGEFSITNVSGGTSVIAVDDTLSISSINDEVFITSDRIEFTNDILGTLTLTAVPNNNTLVLPNQNATLVASVNNSIFADPDTGDITIPYLGGTGTENFVPKWNADGISLTDSIIQQVSTNNIEIGSSSVADTELDLISSSRVDFRMYPYSTTTDYFGIYSYGPTGYGSAYTQIGLNDGVVSNQQGGALYLDTRSLVPPVRLMVKDDTTNTMTAALSVTKEGYVYIGTLSAFPSAATLLKSNFGTDKEIFSLVGFNLDSPTAAAYIQTGMFKGISGSSVDFWAGNSIIAKYNYTGGGLGDSFTIQDSYNSGIATGVVNALKINGSIGNTTIANTVEYNQINISPSYSQLSPFGVPLGTGTIRGIYYNPNVGNINGSKHIAFENTSGNVLLGTTSGQVGIATSTPNAATKLDVNGNCHIGTGSPTTFIGAGHTMEISATGVSVPLTIIGGSPILEAWSNSTRSNGAVAFGAAFPGSISDGNVHISTYRNVTSSWFDRIIVEKDEGRVRIGAGSSVAVSSALLEVNSTTKGFLPPKMTTAQMFAIVSPVEGLIVYNTDAHALVIYGGSPLGWQKISMVPF
jgi:hypothetical protein